MSATQKARKEAEKAEKIKAGLSEAFAGAVRRLPTEIDDVRLVVFSDQHRGTRDGSDDFLRCERAYAAALAYYRALDFELFLLGDVDEIWKCHPSEIRDQYRDVQELEGAFARQGKATRFWGNHDLLWEHTRLFKKHMGQPGQPMEGVTPIEALRWPMTKDGKPAGELLFTHGHQGSLGWVFGQKMILRYGWRRLQSAMFLASTIPAVEWQLRDHHDVTVAEWAAQEPGRLLVTGHTHRPVLAGSLPGPTMRGEPVTEERIAAAQSALADARAAGDKRLEASEAAELEYMRAELRRYGGETMAVDRDELRAAYANTGCCSFGDGDITGLVIDRGTISLVRWPGEEGDALPHQLGEALDLAAMLRGEIVFVD
ncbi:hypothetical protein HJD18_05335 [Thermoleophilia bacterium SCSIO 60948]|nr:hypothetical protein HJD18_05335 [Thermoleophilia bacterium SCSIO 60948]